jgi:excisionase family DNA binding protein
MTIRALREHRRRQNEERLLAGSAWQRRQTDWRGQRRDDLVFTWPDGSLIHPERLSKWFARHCDRTGLPRIRLRDVRHTYASAALANASGWHEMKLISQRLGHANIAVTLDLYAHVLPAADEQAANTLARVILGDQSAGMDEAGVAAVVRIWCIPLVASVARPTPGATGQTDGWLVNAIEGALVTLDELPLLLTVEEAAQVMRLSRNGAYNAVADGVIPSIRIGRTIRIPRDALAAALGLVLSMDDDAADLR